MTISRLINLGLCSVLIVALMLFAFIVGVFIATWDISLLIALANLVVIIGAIIASFWWRITLWPEA